MKYMKITKVEYDNIKNLYLGGKNTYVIAKLYGVSNVTISRILKRIGVPPGIYQTNNNTILSKIKPNIQSNIVDLYKIGKSIKQISDELSLQRYQIRRVLVSKKITLRDFGWEHKTYKTNRHYFDSIDDEYKAYFLGLLCADGCNTKNEKISITLKEEDRNVLDELNHRIHINKKPIKVSWDGNKNHSKIATLTICDMYLAERLSELGVFPNKSLFLKYKTGIVPDLLFNHFLRGYFDGDGCISKKRNYIQFGLVGTESFLSSIKKSIELLLHIKINTKLYDTQSKNIKMFIASKKSDAKPIFEFMYENSNIFLKRKHKIFQSVIYHKNVKYHSKFIGVTFDKSSNKWISYAYKKNKRIFLGKHTTETKAIQSRRKYEKNFIG